MYRVLYLILLGLIALIVRFSIYSPGVAAVSSLPQTVHATLEGQHGTNGWFRSPVTVTLSSSVSSISIQYSLDSGTSWQTYSTPLTFSNQGTMTLSYRGVNAQGTAGPIGSVKFGIDSIPPQTTATVDGKQRSTGYDDPPVTITLTAQDVTSGVVSTLYTYTGQSWWQTYSQPITLSDPGQTELHYYSIDMAGNREQMGAVTIAIAGGKPTVSLLLNGHPYAATTWYGPQTLVTLMPKASDHIPIRAIRYRIDHGATWKRYESPFLWTQQGVSLLEYQAIDVAGDKSPLGKAIIHSDFTAPLIQVQPTHQTVLYNRSFLLTGRIVAGPSGIARSSVIATLDQKPIELKVVMSDEQHATFTIPVHQELAFGTHVFEVFAHSGAGMAVVGVSSVTIYTTVAAVLHDVHALYRRNQIHSQFLEQRLITYLKVAARDIQVGRLRLAATAFAQANSLIRLHTAAFTSYARLVLYQEFSYLRQRYGGG